MKFTVKVHWNSKHEYMEIGWVKVGDRYVSLIDNSFESEFLRSFLLARIFEDGPAISVAAASFQDWIDLAISAGGRVLEAPFTEIEFKIQDYPWFLRNAEIRPEESGWNTLVYPELGEIRCISSYAQAERLRRNLFVANTGEFYFLLEDNEEHLQKIWNQTLSIDPDTQRSNRKRLESLMMKIPGDQMRWSISGQDVPALGENNCVRFDFRPLPYTRFSRFYTIQTLYQMGDGVEFWDSKIAHQDQLHIVISRMFEAIQFYFDNSCSYLSAIEMGDVRMLLTEMASDAGIQATHQSTIDNLSEILKYGKLPMMPYQCFYLSDLEEDRGSLGVNRQWAEETLKLTKKRVKPIPQR